MVYSLLHFIATVRSTFIFNFLKNTCDVQSLGNCSFDIDPKRQLLYMTLGMHVMIGELFFHLRMDLLNL